MLDRIFGKRRAALGATLPEWERTFGRCQRAEFGFRHYARGAYVVSLRAERVARIERIWGDDRARTARSAVPIVTRLLPRDARLVATDTTNDRRVERWHSATLAALFPPESFIGGEPGNCLVIYRVRGDGLVTSAVLAIGDNP